MPGPFLVLMNGCCGALSPCLGLGPGPEHFVKIEESCVVGGAMEAMGRHRVGTDIFEGSLSGRAIE